MTFHFPLLLLSICDYTHLNRLNIFLRFLLEVQVRLAPATRRHFGRLRQHPAPQEAVELVLPQQRLGLRLLLVAVVRRSYVDVRRGKHRLSLRSLHRHPQAGVQEG
eukprot:CAMPEP_0173333542 /NCGR_PEP_ID=MMETSP1144-20121109/4951_1 /TAXON_ID=483371 /ORGANISM="non described non described, Strain CCMP2298" /LENGTH=105 /DNA_ID=CAMNT_0014278519 /DNA_START=304 /DNA_END=621 /DNA_ORIENTATION=-